MDGGWITVVKAPTGGQKTKLEVVSAGDVFTSESSGPDGTVGITDGKVDRSSPSRSTVITRPCP